jgi:hypothetical protein
MNLPPIPRFLWPLLLFAGTANAQWRSQTYELKNGWNAIWLPGDATYQSVAEHLAGSPAIVQVWRWDARANSIQFTSSPNELFSASNQWAVWNRNDPNAQNLRDLLGNMPYLVQTSAATSWTIRYKVQAPVATWQTTGANLLGFPAAESGSPTPTFQTYFASLVFGGARGLPSSARIFQYVGGEMARNVNPISVPSSARIDPRAAYWITLPSATDFTAPVEFELPGSAIDFGRTQSTLTMGIKNRTTSALTLTLELESSQTAPAGQPVVTGNVPLVIRTFDSASKQYTDTPLVGKTTIPVAASSTTEMLLALDRTQLGGDAGALYASILKITDSANLTLTRLPVRAEPASAAGLWTCMVSLGQVDPLDPTTPGSATNRAFTLKYLVHVDEAGRMRLLRSCFLGQLKATGKPLGIAIHESDVHATGEAEVTPRRFFSSLLPAGQAVVEGDIPYEKGASVLWNITHFANDPVNPFRHNYHPDHPSGLEIRRALTMEFTTEPPEIMATAPLLAAAWGTSILGGTYTEQISGLTNAATPITTRGTFLMRRISEISSIQLD